MNAPTGPIHCEWCSWSDDRGWPDADNAWVVHARTRHGQMPCRVPPGRSGSDPAPDEITRRLQPVVETLRRQAGPFTGRAAAMLTRLLRRT
jgi:hypothetical protein